jgi:hypothetical protein
MKKKCVTFSEYEEIIIIKLCESIEPLWWSNEEMKDMLVEARNELIYFVKYNPSINFKEAQKLLYNN